jgi:hypothetical protein
MQSPRVSPVDSDWNAARASLTNLGLTTSPEALTQLNTVTARAFANLVASPVPVMLPFDTAAYLRDAAQDAAGDATKYLSGFTTTLFFPGPSGYDAVLSLRPEAAPDLGLTFIKPLNVEITGSNFIYELDGPQLPAGDAVPQLDSRFPGIRRILLESRVRYTFSRFGVPYAIAIICFDGPSSTRRLSCRDADKVALRVLNALNFVGGTPQMTAVAPQTIHRPEQISPDFTYYPPGDLLPGTGMKGNSGHADTTVYAEIRFPLAQPPAYAHSQSFMNWGNCDLTGRVGLGGRNNTEGYHCRVNDKPLVNDEAKNFAYPWRDNFCEHRYYEVSRCPAGVGHQGQDIEGGPCLQRNESAGRCEPYQEDVVAVSDGVIMRSAGDEAVYLLVDKPGVHVRFRYLHMNPAMLDAAGVVSGRVVSEGEVIGAIGNSGPNEGGTSYHLHFDAQAPTRDGWAFFNPYMTLVAAYERLIGGRGEVVTDAMFAAAPPAPDGVANDADGHGITEASKLSEPGVKVAVDEPKIVAAEHCTTHVVKGHRRRLCRSDVAETRGRTRHAADIRAVDHGVSGEGHGARHHRGYVHARHAGTAS